SGLLPQRPLSGPPVRNRRRRRRWGRLLPRPPAMKKLLFSLFAAAALACGAAQAQQVQPLDGIAAVVDEDVILNSELDRALAIVRAQYRGQEHQLPPLPILQRQVLERLSLLRLHTERAPATGCRVTDAEVAATSDAIAAQNGMTPSQLR